MGAKTVFVARRPAQGRGCPTCCHRPPSFLSANTGLNQMTKADELMRYARALRPPWKAQT